MKLLRPLYLLLIFLLFGVPVILSAQQNLLRFKHLTINDGLSLSSVYVIFQDSKGFMWFGTEDGLNKYDGKRFRVYRPDPQSIKSLSYKWTEIIYEDSKGQLWFGSKGGLTKFNPELEQFTRYGTEEEKFRLEGDTITFLAEGQKDQLWVGTTSGINMINLSSGEVELVDLHDEQINHIFSNEYEIWVGTEQGTYHKAINDSSFQNVSLTESNIQNRAVYAITRDKDGHIWLGMGNSIYEISHENGEMNWKPITDTQLSNQLGDQVQKLIIDENQTLWISSSSGLFKYDKKNGQLTPIVHSIDASHSLAINPAKAICLDKSDNLWYGTYGQGLYRIDVKTSQVNIFRNNPGDTQSISENSINSIFEDKAGNIWIGTFGAGINIYQPDAHKFGYMSHQPMIPNSLSSSFIWSIMECRNGRLWIGTNDAGLNIYDPVMDSYEVLDHDPANSTSLSHSSVRKIYQDSKGRIWIGTDGGGLNRYYPESRQFRQYQTIPSDPTSISSNSVRVIYEDKQQRLWVGTRSGLNLFNPDDGRFTRFLHQPSDPNSLSNNFVYSAIHHDENGYLWVGTYGGGLNRLDINTGRFKSYMTNPTDTESLSDNIVFSIYEDSTGIFWIGTNSGLNRFDPVTEKFQHFGIAEGLPNEVIYGIIADDNNHLWLSTNKGICRFSLGNYGVKNFTINDGLQSNEFNGGAFHKGHSGNMYFGGVYGLNIINQNLSYVEENHSKITITGLSILGKEVKTFAGSSVSEHESKIFSIDDEYYMPKNISYADDISLEYQHRFTTIEFAALNSTSTLDLRFQYMLEGLDNTWHDVGNRTYITFANLQPGSYGLHVRSFNSDDFQSASNAYLKVTITPPFWKTWWFYLLEFLVLAVMLGFIYRYLLKIRTNRLLKIQNEKIYTANQKLLESEKNLKQLNATKDKFFSIISHDLKNPFTSLLSISELLVTDFKEIDEEDKEEGITRVHDSAKRIYNLLENLLTWSRAQSGKISFSPNIFDLSALVHNNLKLLDEFARNKNIQLQIELENGIMAFGDHEMIDTVLRNLLSNAIKFTPSDKYIKVSILDSGAFWSVSIQDEGIGITSENLDKIFQIDRKFKTEGTAGEKGTGLGLLICKEFIEKNGGSIHIESEIGKGSNFQFTIPKRSGFVK